VKICSLYGAGFYYIPGTDTCIKIGGYVRAEVNVNANGSFNPFHAQILDSRTKNEDVWRSRGVITFDVRSQTEYGTLRSYVGLGEQVTNGGGGTGVQTYANRIFIQWAGFTAGLASSYFDFFVTPKYSNTTNILGSDTGGGGDQVFAYTAQLGNGLSATLSAEDMDARRTAIGGGPVYAGREWPDVVANLRIDQAWGSAQVMGAIHQVRTVSGAYPNETGDDETGWAVGAGLKLNMPWVKGDSIAAQVTWAKGALAYVGSGLSNLAITRDATTAFGPTFDAVAVPGGLDLTEGWSIVGGAEHHWSSQWKTDLYGTYGAFNYSDAASAVILPGGSADWDMWQVSSRTVWSPVKNLDLSVEIMYNHIDTAFDAKPAADSKSWWQGMFRVQRNFWP
jgi:hypothetical protein